LLFSSHGFEIVDEFIDEKYLVDITSEMDSSNILISGGGLRNPETKYKSVRDLLASGLLSELAESYLEGYPQFVRAILFNKTPSNNWLVSWHQDKTIAVSCKKEVDGWGPWSIKSGRHHVQPDVSVLNSMVTFRIHLDESTDENGCVRLIPGSHKQGLMSATEISSYIQYAKSVQCIAKRYSVLVMRPHILHASSKAKNPSNRRVLHLEYSSYNLPNGLKWV